MTSWAALGPVRNKILFGVIGEENSARPGTYAFNSTCGIAVKDAHVITPDASKQGHGSIAKPDPGTPCVAVATAAGGQIFIIGFQVMPVFDEESDDDPAVAVPSETNVSGDKVYSTASGARLILRRGGSVNLEGGPGATILLNPVNNQASLRSSNFYQSADGYMARRGREKASSTDAATFHKEAYWHQVGNSYDRMTVEHGSIEGGARRRLTLATVTVTGGVETATIRTRETYKSDGSWVGEGPKYQWGGDSADEPAVLGQQLVDVLSSLIDTINKLQVNTAWGPSTPPLPTIQAELNQLKSSLSGKILSTFLFLSKDPSSLV